MHKPLLVMLSGLPGCGKSTVAKALVQRLPQLNLAIVASDQVRKELFPEPSYSDEESRVAHQAVQERVLDHLRSGRSVIHDATHLQRQFRLWRHEAEALTGCRSVLIRVWLDEATTRTRLAQRQLHNDGWTDADFSIYQLLQESAETIRSPHLTICTNERFEQDMLAAIEHIDKLYAATAERITKEKAFCYLTREGQLLVFEHPEHPEAGIQVVAGTVEAGESAETAALREAHEETGLSDISLVGLIGKQTRDMSDYGKNELHQRSFYHLAISQRTPERWQHWEQFGSDGAQHLFEFYWVDLDSVPDLVADHGLFVSALQ